MCLCRLALQVTTSRPGPSPRFRPLFMLRLPILGQACGSVGSKEPCVGFSKANCCRIHAGPSILSLRRSSGRLGPVRHNCEKFNDPRTQQCAMQAEWRCQWRCSSTDKRQHPMIPARSLWLLGKGAKMTRAACSYRGHARNASASSPSSRGLRKSCSPRTIAFRSAPQHSSQTIRTQGL